MNGVFWRAGEGEGITLGIEGGLEVAQVEGVADSQRKPRRTKSPSSDRYAQETEIQYLTSNTSIPAVKIKSSSS